jgi:mitochondrial fission process protein 1
MLSAHRYVAYTSDIGESFRPIAHPWLVRGAYGISWAYLIGDVSHEGYKAYHRNQRLLHPEQNEHFDATAPKKEMPATMARPDGTPIHIPAIEDYRTIIAQRAIFQSVASMGLPAFTIHSIVRYSGKAFKNAANATIRTWAPIGVSGSLPVEWAPVDAHQLGLAAVPALPYMFDEPVENAVEWGFYHAFKAIGGDQAVGNRPVTGRSHQMVKENRLAEKVKEKEL